MLKQPTARVLRVSKAFIEASSFEFFARAQGYSSVSAARVVVCRWRDEYGVVLFPYKNRGRANRVSEISAAWCASNNPRAIAKKLEFPSVEALFTTICRLRTKHGTVLFPLKKNYTRIKTLKVAEPAKRGAGVKVPDVATLVDKLKNEAKVI